MTLLMLLSCIKTIQQPLQNTSVHFDQLTEGQVVSGFVVRGLYTDAEDRAIGAELVHQHTGFELELLQMPSVPRAIIWVNTVPPDDSGVPHTQEHLLLGKGNRGRNVASQEEMSLVESGAFTERMRTVYHFHTLAGVDAYYKTLRLRLHAMLEPDYSDAEIRKEVYHLGVATDPTSGELSLEEKGTVFNEMDTTSRSKWGNIWQAIEDDIWGPDHPQSRDSGGDPEAMRSLTPTEIRAYHADTHALGNMGMLAVIPTASTLSSALERHDALLRSLQPDPTPADAAWPTERTLPPWTTAEARAPREVPYPVAPGDGTSSIWLAWAPRGDRSMGESRLLQLFFDGVISGAAAPLYKAMVDGETRERDLGATGLSAWEGDGPGSPLMLSVSGLPRDLDDEARDWAVTRARSELARVAALPDGDPELVELNERLRNRMTAFRRDDRRLLSKSIGTGWRDYLDKLDASGRFRRSLVGGESMDWVDAQLERDDNLWREWIEVWGLKDDPLVFVNRPDEELLTTLDAAQEARLAAATTALRLRYGVDDDQAALRQLAEELEAETATIDAGRTAPPLRFIDDPPMSWDPELEPLQRDLGGVPTTVLRFDGMVDAWVVLYLDLHAVPAEHWDLLSFISVAFDSVGVSGEDPLDHTEVTERLLQQVSGTWVSTSSRADRDRAEFVLGGGGTELKETRAALRWMKRFLLQPDWREENLPRLVHLADQRAERVFNSRPSAGQWSWRHQRQPLSLHLTSGSTRELDILRLKWRLREPAPGALKALEALAAVQLDRDGRDALLEALASKEGSESAAVWPTHPDAREQVSEFARDLQRLIEDFPEQTLAEDWALAVTQARDALEQEPSTVLTDLRSLRESLLHRDIARLALIGGSQLDSLDADVLELIAMLNATPAALTENLGPAVARERVGARGGDPQAIHLSRLDPKAHAGAITVKVPFVGLSQTDDDAVLDVLAAHVLAGGGAHSLFMRTWGEGLAYNNGLSTNLAAGILQWSADRCPDVGETVAFAHTVAATPVDEDLAEYTIAQTFSSRAAKGYYSRGLAMATDLAEGEPPALVETFRTAILRQREREDLVSQLETRLPNVLDQVIPGLGEPMTEGSTRIRGDADQLEKWNAWLQVHEGALAQPLWPRDFWLPE